MYEHIRCQVYNSNYQPLQPVSCKRALNLVLQDKAVIIQAHPVYVVNAAKTSIPLPVRIALKTYKKNNLDSNKPAVLTNPSLFIRDKYTCQYCGRHKTNLNKDKGEKLTRDHVHPRDLGGPDIWINVVTACSTCNTRKANKPLSQTGMKLIARQPYAPTRFEIWARKQEHLDKFIDGGEL